MHPIISSATSLRLLNNKKQDKNNKCIDRNVMCQDTSLNEGSDTYDCYQLWQSQHVAFHPWRRGHCWSLSSPTPDSDFSSLDAAESPGVQRHAPFGAVYPASAAQCSARLF